MKKPGIRIVKGRWKPLEAQRAKVDAGILPSKPRPVAARGYVHTRASVSPAVVAEFGQRLTEAGIVHGGTPAPVTLTPHTVTVQTKEGPETHEGCPGTGGLAITPSGSGRYTVTHVLSGLAVGDPDSSQYARALLLALLPLADWTQPKEHFAGLKLSDAVWEAQQTAREGRRSRLYRAAPPLADLVALCAPRASVYALSRGEGAAIDAADLLCALASTDERLLRDMRASIQTHAAPLWARITPPGFRFHGAPTNPLTP